MSHAKLKRSSHTKQNRSVTDLLAYQNNEYPERTRHQARGYRFALPSNIISPRVVVPSQKKKGKTREYHSNSSVQTRTKESPSLTPSLNSSSSETSAASSSVSSSSVRIASNSLALSSTSPALDAAPASPRTMSWLRRKKKDKKKKRKGSNNPSSSSSSPNSSANKGSSSPRPNGKMPYASVMARAHTSPNVMGAQKKPPGSDKITVSSSSKKGASPTTKTDSIETASNLHPGHAKMMAQRKKKRRSKADLQKKNEMELLKCMKDTIKERLHELTKDHPALQQEIRESLQEIWLLEYSILKSKLKSHVTEKKSKKQKEDTAKVLTKYRHLELEEDDDMKEMSRWLMTDFFEKGTNELTTKNTLIEEDSESDEPGLVIEEEIEPLERLKRAAHKVMVAQIMFNAKQANSQSATLEANPQLQACLAQLGEWQFDPFALLTVDVAKDRALVLSVFKILRDLNVMGDLGISKRKMWNFLQSVESGYNDIPYHNKFHAIDVTNTTYFTLQSNFFQNHVSKLDQFAAILAAAVHDLGHDGFNNAWHINVGSDIAMTYNDASVLESYHISQAFFLLKKSQNNWFQKIPRSIKRYLRAMMITMVLSTDMHFHFREVSRLDQFTSRLKSKIIPAGEGHGKSGSSGQAGSSGTGLNSSNLIALVRGGVKGGSALTLGGAGEVEVSRTLEESKTDHHDLPLITPGINSNESTDGGGPNQVKTNRPLGGIGSVSSVTSLRRYASYAEIPLQRTKKAPSHGMLTSISSGRNGAQYDDSLLKTVIENEIVDTDETRVTGVDDERRFLLGAAIHLCDISNPTKYLDVSIKWAKLIMEEFFTQGDNEIALKLPLSPMMDRKKATIEGGQIGFIQFIVMPIFEKFVHLVPEYEPAIDQMKSNLTHWLKTRAEAKVQRRQSLKVVGRSGSGSGTKGNEKTASIKTRKRTDDE